MPNKTHSNQYFDTLIRTGKWLIEPEYGEKAFGKYMSELALLNAGVATLKDLYTQPKVWFDDEEEGVRKKKIVRNYTDYVITVKGNKKVASRWSYNDYEEEPTPNGVVRVIAFSGVMTKRGGLSTSGIDVICEEFDKGYEDESVSGIVLDLDTGGGGVQAADMLGLKIAQRNKPVLAAVTNAYSGGAWATAEADHIMGIGSTAGFGSIGVMVEFDNRDKYWEEKGWVTHRFYATKSKDKNRGYEEAIKGKYKYYIVNNLDPLCDLFIEKMSAGRPLTIEDKEWQSGKTFMTKEAIELGLCDSQGTLQDAILKCQTLAEKQQAKQQTNTLKNISMEEKIKDLHQAFGGIIAANVETGEDATKLQTEANGKMVVAYGAAVAAAQMKDRDIQSLQQEIQQLSAANEKLEATIEENKTALEKAQDTSTQVAKADYDKVVAERDKATIDLKAQIAHTNQLIKDNKLNVDTTKEQEQEQQVEDTMEEDEKPLTKEQAAYQRIKNLGYKGNISMGEVPKGRK